MTHYTLVSIKAFTALSSYETINVHNALFICILILFSGLLYWNIIIEHCNLSYNRDASYHGPSSPVVN